MTGDVYLLGGRDLEMVAVRDLLAAGGAAFHDKGLAWGARASAYRDEIAAAVAAGRTPVLVELEPDLDLPAAAVAVDHHGPRAGRDTPTSLEQVFARLRLPPDRWTRRLALVAANDRGHTAGMLALDPPAAPDELRAVRAADRAAQGVSPADEASAAAAADRAEVRAEGRLLVVRLLHDRASAVADRLDAALGGPGFENLLVLTPVGGHFFGNGRVVAGLAELRPGGWYGGALPARGYWGAAGAADGLVELAAGLAVAGTT